MTGESLDVNSIAISPDGAMLTAGSWWGGTITLWDVAQYFARRNPNPDFDGDGTVDFDDFVLFAGKFGSRQGDAEYEFRFDLDGDGAIGFSDFLVFAGAFGPLTVPAD